MINTKDSHLREHRLSRWVVRILSEEKIAQDNDGGLLPLQEIGSDAGFRRYYRVQTPDGTLVAVDAPPETEDLESFIKIGRLWRKAGIRVPDIIESDVVTGFMMLEDFGDIHLQDHLLPETADQYYTWCFKTLLQIQQQSPESLPVYDKALQYRELELYPQWFLTGLLGIEEQIPDLTPVFDSLSEAFSQQPQGSVHRDYHSRNLMLLPDGGLGVIDFQGALHGPLLYDLVSLLRDCYLSWAEDKVSDWLSQFVKMQPLLSDYDDEQLQGWFDFTGLQRHLKCLGIFSRLWLRDSKPGFLPYILSTFEQVVTISHKYPCFREHATWLEQNVRPVLTAHLARVQEGVDV